MATDTGLPSALAEALKKVEVCYERCVLWLAHMYDPVTGGFYMAMSGANDPAMEPAIEMTAWGVSFLENYTDALSSAPDRFREGIVSFMNDRQDPVSGLFTDRQGAVNARETARNQAAAFRALSVMGARPRYPHPRDTASAAERTPVMPPYMESAEAYVDWVAGMNWDHASWSAGDQTQSSLQYVQMLEPQKQAAYKEALFAWLDARQQASGLWSPDYDFNAASGAFKVGLVYSACGKRLPNHERIIDAVFRCYETAKTTSPFFVRNPISVLHQMAAYSAEAKAKIQAGILSHIDAVTASFGEFLCPDGAFSAGKGKSMISFGGVTGSHSLFEGDIDATLMMLIARKTLYSIFDAQAPLLNTDDFWAWIYGETPMPRL